MARGSIAALAAFLALAAGDGCGGGHGQADASQGQGGPPADVGQYVAALQDVLCGAQAAGCCASVGARADVAACMKLVSDSVDIMKAHVAPPPAQAVFNADAAQACLDLARSIVGVCGRFFYDLQNPPCGTVLSPPAEADAGASCGTSADCPQPAGATAWCQTGRCAQHALATAGQPCTDDEDCRPAGALECGHDTHTCHARVALGASCADRRDCADWGAGCAGGVCVAPAQSGEVCLTEAVGQRFCERGLACQNGTCARGLAAGSACASAPEDCENGSLCVLVDATRGKQCVWQGLLGVCTSL